MGVTAETWKLLTKYLDTNNIKSICELGDQQFMSCSPFKEFSWTKEYFDNNGYEYLSIDLNGLGGSLVLDLDKPIIEKTLINKFDIVTNFGTLEHTLNLYQGLKNMHDLCTTDGFMFHVGPSPTFWKGHGNWYLDTDFYDKLGKLCDYEILEVFKRKLEVGGVDSVQTHCVFKKKKESVFCSIEDFNKLPIYKE